MKPWRRNRDGQAMSKPQSQSTASLLLQMPGEIRNQIYNNLIVLPEPVHIYQQSNASDISADQPPEGLHARLVSLFLTCKQVHLEASALFYSQNQFTLPTNSSAAPHQIQANFLFRWFLDRIGPRNAAAIRYLAVPFPADPAALISAHFAGTSSSAEDTLIPAIQQRCPNLETIDFDVRWNNHWVRLLCPSTPTVQSMFGRLDEVLRAEFPKLKNIGLCLAGPGRKYAFTGPFTGNAVEIPHDEWQWFTETLEDGSGWQVDAAAADRDPEPQDDEDVNVSALGVDGVAGSRGGWMSLWYPHAPPGPVAGGTNVHWLMMGDLVARDAAAALREQPDMATIDSEDLGRGARLAASITSKAKYARAWLRSPTQAVNDRETAEEWMQWRRTMLAQAGPYIFPRTCFSIGGESTNTSRRKRLASRLRGLLPV